MHFLAHVDTGYAWSSAFHPWELHPALNHLPIAFLLGGVALDLYAWFRSRPSLVQVATGLLMAGAVTGALAALAGVLAFFTVPAHTGDAHRLMFWHGAIQAIALAIFAILAWKRRRLRLALPGSGLRLLGCFAALLVLVGSAVGGYIVYHGGAGIDPKLLAPEVRKSHSHSEAAEDSHSTDADHAH
jgi:uncharacterized membrane protein